MTTFFSILEEHKEVITDAVLQRVLADNPFYRTLPYAEVRRRVLAGLEPYARDLDEPTPRYFAEYWRLTAIQRARQGVPLAAFLGTLLAASEEMLCGLRATAPDDAQFQIKILELGYTVTASGIAAVYDGYAQHKDTIIQMQASTIEEVALPVVPVHTGILVMPLIGEIDARRAAQIMEGVLSGISAQQAEVVILDITGVAMVDTSTAQHLIQVTRAARLLGTTVILVGIRADIAQTMVSLGIDLTNIVTLANLQAGIAYALAAQGLMITPIRQDKLIGNRKQGAARTLPKAPEVPNVYTPHD